MMETKLLVSPAAIVSAPETKQTLSATTLSDDGRFEGYASLFNVPDLGNDVVMPKAFSATLRKRGASGIKMLWQHNAAEPIGIWVQIEEDHIGLKVSGRLNLEIGRAREVYSLMRDGSVDGLSIGFRTEKAVRDRKTGLRRLEKLDLWEISVVTFPMLPQARVSAVKRGHFKTDGIANRGQMAATRVKRALSDATHILR